MVQNRTSVGIVLFRESQGTSGAAKNGGPIRAKGGMREYLLLHYAAGHWDFPKGGVEAGESDEQTLRRELLEETSIEKVDLIAGFRHELSYFFREQGELIRKTVVFYLGQTRQAGVKLSFEHKDFTWLPYENAMSQLTHKNAKELLEKAERFLEENQRPSG